MELGTTVGRPLIAERIAGSGERAVLACGKTVDNYAWAHGRSLTPYL